MAVAVNVFAQKTPNPEAYKFACSLKLVPEGFYEFTPAHFPTGVPFVDAFFERWDAKRVYITDNFITVLKGKTFEWFEIVREVREHIAENLREERYTPDSLPAQGKVQVPDTHTGLEDWFYGKILQATSQDGGGIFLVSYANDEMTLKLAGACVDCPYAPMTIEQGVVIPLNKSLPKPLKKVHVVA
jgi:Fe-S cluster biogenesis protein NfuA